MYKSKALMLGCLLAITALCTTAAKAQTNADIDKAQMLAVANYVDQQAAVQDTVTPALDGTEKNLTDSLLSYGKAITDPALKTTIVDAINVIKTAPKGGGVEDWIGWALGIVGALIAVYQFVRAKFHKIDNDSLRQQLLVHQSAALTKTVADVPKARPNPVVSEPAKATPITKAAPKK